MKRLRAIRCRFLVWLTHEIALPILKLVRKEKLFPYTVNDLYKMDQGTVGNDLLQFLHHRQLHLLAYYEKHDIKHLLLDYDTTEEGEICMQCFMLGNGHFSFPVGITVFFGMVATPEYWRKMITAYKRGRHAIKLYNWDWFALVPEQTDNIKALINA